MRNVGRVLFLLIATPLGRWLFDSYYGAAFVAAFVALIIIEMGLWGIRLLAAAVPEPLEPGEMRKVKLLYRCDICGTEMRMTAAPSEDPPPPRHCMEDMDLLNATE